jgi:GNAT superfamily N-acetyltransferase
MMSDAQPLTPGEMPEAIRLLDGVFKKPGRKGSIYDWTPTLLEDGNTGYVHAVRADGRIVSVAGFKIVPMRFRGMELSAALIGAVATHPDWRGRGYSGHVLESLTAGMAASSVDFSALWSASPGFYMRYGWKPAGIEERWHVFPGEALRESTAREFSGDYARLQRLRERSAYLHTVRTERETRLLLEGSPIRMALETDEGYAVYERWADHADMLETGGEPGDLPALLAGIWHREGPMECRMQLAPGDPRPEALRRTGLSLCGETREAAMFRVESADAFLSKLAAAGLPARSGTDAGEVFGSPGRLDAPLAGMCINWLDHV